MKEKQIVIIGGGLAGLTASLHLASAGFQIKLFEKDTYPNHKVCGEYLSREILPYMNTLGAPLNLLNPVAIEQLLYSSPSGKVIKAELPLGGIGISRYALDNFLYQKALEGGVEVINDNITDIDFSENRFQILTVNGVVAESLLVLGAYGKRSLLDKKLNRGFIKKKTGWLAVKAHYELDSFPDNLVALHNFKGGYCGLSKTETSAINVCYLATYNSFKKHKNADVYKQEVLMKNKHLNSFFKKAKPLFSKDLTIAQISFDQKTRVQDHVLMLGDAAGLIHPLCGNGMAMAIHSAKIASETIIEHYDPMSLNRKKLEEVYNKRWNKTFRSRLQTGRILQKILLNPGMAEFSQNALNVFPSLLPGIIKRTHGNQVL